MRVAMTGASGLVGRHVLASLERDGSEVVALSRRPEALPDGVATVRGDIEDEESLAKLVDGVDAVVHTAGLVRSADVRALERMNVVAAAAVAQAATRAHVPRFVHVSSAGVLGRPGGIVDEASPLRPHGPYEASKARGEAAVRRSFEGRLSVVRPSNVLAPEHPMRPLLRLFSNVRSRPVLIGANAHANYVSADLVGQVIAAMVRAEQVHDVLIVNQPMKLQDLIERVAAAAGTTPRVRELPVVLSRTLEVSLRVAWQSSASFSRPYSLFDSTSLRTAYPEFGKIHGPFPDLTLTLTAMAHRYKSEGLL